MDFAKKKGLKIVTLPHLCNIFFSDLVFKAIHLYDVSAKDFLSLIKNAEYVFTDSFHAGVFSNIYSVKYCIFSRKGTSMEERIHTLLDVFDSQERFCVGKERENLDYILSLSEIENLIKPDKLMKAQRESVEFLKNHLYKTIKERE